MSIIIQDRDNIIVQEITKFRFCLSRQIRILANFNGQRACDRRIKKLIEANYLERKYLIYGIPGLIFTTKEAKKLFNLEYLTTEIRIEQIRHEVAVVDTAIYFIYKKKVDRMSIVTERQLKHKDGFGNPVHRPDFVFAKDGTECCVEVELSIKKIDTLEKNIKRNYMSYEIQYWIIDNEKIKINENLKSLMKKYNNIQIISLNVVNDYVKNL